MHLEVGELEWAEERLSCGQCLKRPNKGGDVMLLCSSRPDQTRPTNETKTTSRNQTNEFTIYGA